MKIALTGGIACGKSTLAKFLRELGIRLLDADDVVHELEAPGGEAVPALVARFGSGILASDGGIDRGRLAEAAFTAADAARARADLEAILFPRVRAALRAFTVPADQAAQNAGGESEIRIAVIPLLFESHFDADYDTIVAIASPVEVQIGRMMRTRGYTRAQAEARLAAQMPAAEKAARAHFTVMNDSTPRHLRSEASRLVAWLKERIKNEQRRAGQHADCVVPRRSSRG